MMKHSRNRRVMLASSAGAVQRFAQVLATLIVTPILLHALGTRKFGIWGAATSLAWLAGLADIGTSYALVTLVARSMARKKINKARQQIAGGLTQSSYLTVLMLVVILLIRLSGGLRDSGAIYLTAALTLALNLPLHAASNVFMGLQEGYHSSLWELIQTLLTAVGLLIATLFTRDTQLFVLIVYSGLVASNLGCTIHLFLAHPELRPERFPMPWVAMREVTSAGTQFFLMMVAGMLSFALDNMLALELLGPNASAQMAVAMRICLAATGLLVVVSQPLWPAFADAAHRNDWRWILHSAIRGGAWIMAAAIAGCAAMMVFGERLLGLWLHANLGIGRSLLWAVAAWIFTQALVRIPFLLLNGLSMVRFQAGLFSLATTVALALKFLLARTLGVSGILWATSAVVGLIVFPASLWRLWHWAQHSKKASSLADLSPDKAISIHTK